MSHIVGGSRPLKGQMPHLLFPYYSHSNKPPSLVFTWLVRQAPAKTRYHDQKERSYRVDETFLKESRLLLETEWMVNIVTNMNLHMGPEHASREKKLMRVIFFIFVHKNVFTIRFQEIKISPLEGFEKIKFFSLFLIKKRLSSGQKWLLRPYFPLISGMLVFRSGLRFSFWAFKSEEKVVLDPIFSKPSNGPFSISWNLILYTFKSKKLP